jgi:UDP-N-acetylmuramoyl-tripeptide--D-alanyl-D-alanine ligase
MFTFAGTLSDIAAAVRGTLAPTFAGVPVSGVAIDSRQVGAGDVFIALGGTQADGHVFVAAALESGAAGAIVAKVPEGLSVETASLIVVPDTLLALGALGAAARAASDAFVIGVTGSAGKTTVKNMVAAVLAQAGPTLATEGNYNTEIGLPLMLLKLRPEHRFCVLELAMRGRDQIHYLARICHPHVGVITNIGESHFGLLGSREAIAQAKAEILASLPADGVAVLPRDDFFFDLLSELAPCPVTSFGEGDDADIQVANVRIEGLEGVRCSLRAGDEEAELFLGIPGRHIAVNAGAAAGACLAAGLSLADVARGLEGFTAADMRMHVTRTPAGYTVINDAYNASPAAVLAALEVLEAQPGRKIFVFGDMLELGPLTREAHERVGRVVAESGVAWMVSVGEWAGVAAEMAEGLGVPVSRFMDREEALQAVKAGLQPGDVVLVKASRGIGLDTIARGLADVA